MLRVAASLVQDSAIAPDVAVQVTRVLGQSVARIADAQATSFEQALADEPELLSGALEGLRPRLQSFLTYAWRRHLAAALHNRMTASGSGGRAETLCVGFADLVGFTAASQELSYHELATMVERFEALAYDIIATHGGHVIKMIGDEVMFSVASAPRPGAPRSTSPRPASRIASSRPPGSVWPGATRLRHEADLYGPTVNLASRLVNLAQPGSVLVSDELAGAIVDDAAFTVRRLRARRLQGIGQVRFHLLRRSADLTGR